MTNFFFSFLIFFPVNCKISERQWHRWKCKTQIEHNRNNPYKRNHVAFFTTLRQFLLQVYCMPQQCVSKLMCSLQCYMATREHFDNVICMSWRVISALRRSRWFTVHNNWEIVPQCCNVSVLHVHLYFFYLWLIFRNKLSSSHFSCHGYWNYTEEIV